MRKEYGGFLVPKTMFADAFDFVITFVFVLAWLSMNYGNNYLESVKSNNFLVMTNECLAIVQNNKLLFMRFRLLEWVIFYKFYSSSMLKQWNDVSFFTAPALIYRSGCLMNYFPNFWQSLNMVFLWRKNLQMFEHLWDAMKVSGILISFFWHSASVKKKMELRFLWEKNLKMKNNFF